ncbi:MAG: hypothetical protein LYZ69_00385 [Nitrososphaerales archaeon]|nr:hypothetical protein [Nitrososphaerales archaeon]
MESNKRITDLFERVRAPFKKLGETVGQTASSDDDLIHAVIQRIDVEGETSLPEAQPQGGYDREEMYKRLLRRLDWQVRKSGIGAEELVRTYGGEVQAVLLHKSYERFRNKSSDVLRGKFIELGLKNVQPGVWVLPPNRVPSGLTTQDELRMWVRRELAKPLGKDFDYVFSFVAVVDLKKVIAERKGIRKMPVARTIYNVLEVDEVVPPSHLYATLKSRSMGVRDIILSGDFPFLASAFAEDEDVAAIKEHEEEIATRLRNATGSKSAALEDIANLGADIIGASLEGIVAHPKDLAQRLIVEAQYWMRFLGGSVPGMSFLSGSAPE